MSAPGQLRGDIAIETILFNERALLRDILRSGGRDNYDHLKSHGHHHSTIRRAIHIGFIKEPEPRRYRLTKAGRVQLNLIGAPGRQHLAAQSP